MYFIFLLCFFLISSEAKIYNPCDLSRELVHKHGFPKDKIADWICLIDHESKYNTAALGRLNSDGSADHGIFQINDRYWCSPPDGINECHMRCDDLRNDDLSDDARCAKKIFSVHGFYGWNAWKAYCNGRDVRKYIQHCHV